MSEGITHLRTPFQNKGLLYTDEERDQLKLRGLLPSGSITLRVQADVAIAQLRAKSTPLEKFIFMQHLQDTNEKLYYTLLVENVYELLPIVYTPTVGEGCLQWSRLFLSRGGSPRGLYISYHQDKGHVRQVLDNWPEKNIRAIVFTDGERILGLGDLGVNGMGIPVGKLALYTTCGGVPPENCLPVVLDLGTNNQGLLKDPTYIGTKKARASQKEYDEFVHEFMTACQDAYGPDVLLQFEDWGNRHAFRLLEDWRDKACCFNDDIQGTAGAVLAGLLASVRLTGRPLQDHVFLFLGAGMAGVGIADLIAIAIERTVGIPRDEARKKIFLVDSQGLVVASRKDSLQSHKLAYAHEHEECGDFLTSIKKVKPTALIGVSAQPKVFDNEVLKAMSEPNDLPIIFALSNPASKAECTAEEAYLATNGKCIFASGSPFEPVKLPDGRTLVPGQANNCYMFIAAKTLAEQVPQSCLDVGQVYPPLRDIREVSAHIAAAVAEEAYRRGTATLQPKPADLLAHCRKLMYDPRL